MRRTIRKLVMMMIVLCLASIAYTIYFAHEVYSTRHNYENVINEYVRVEQDIHNLNERVYYIQTLTLSQIIADDKKEVDYLEQKIDEEHRQNLESIKKAESLLEDKSEKELWHLINSNYLTYKQQQEMIANMKGKSADNTALYYANTVLTERINVLNEALTQLSDKMDTKLVVLRERSQKQWRVSHVTMMIIVLGNIILMLFMIRRFSKSSGEFVVRYNEEQREHREQIIHMQGSTIANMAELVEMRDGETGTHIKNTATYVERIARQLSKKEKYQDILTPEYIEKLRQYAPLHDIGKIVISDIILLKPGKFTNDEFEIMKTHTVEGDRIVERILSDVESEENVEMARNIARYHHERWNGKGYPAGLAKEEIPLCARIMSVADVFDALISKRVYKEAFPVDKAFQIINEERGEQFDPDVVDAFSELRAEIEDYLES